MVICLFQHNQLIDLFIILIVLVLDPLILDMQCVMHSLPNYLKDVMHNNKAHHWIPILTFYCMMHVPKKWISKEINASLFIYVICLGFIKIISLVLSRMVLRLLKWTRMERTLVLDSYVGWCFWGLLEDVSSFHQVHCNLILKFKTFFLEFLNPPSSIYLGVHFHVYQDSHMGSSSTSTLVCLQSNKLIL